MKSNRLPEGKSALKNRFFIRDQNNRNSGTSHLTKEIGTMQVDIIIDQDTQIVKHIFDGKAVLFVAELCYNDV